MNIRYSPEAAADVESIERYSLDTYGEELGGDYMDSMVGRVERIAQLPGIGRPVSGRPGLQGLLSGQHVIYYRVRAQAEIEIVRILHQSMDAEHQL